MSANQPAQPADAAHGSSDQPGGHPDGHGDHHGSTPAAWTTVTIIMVAFVLGSVAMMVGAWWLFWVAAALLPVAAIVGKVMASAGLGATPRSAGPAPSSETQPSG